MSETDKSEYSDIFVLTVDSVQNYEGAVIPFPLTVGSWGTGDSCNEARCSANQELRKSASKLSANAVIGVKYSTPERMSGGWWMYATGTPVYLDPPLSEMYNELKRLKSQEEE